MASAVSPSEHGGLGLEGGSRPAVSINRLPVRRHSDGPKEAMNCKSCRKRKIKCNRARPVCESCTTFSCICVYGVYLSEGLRKGLVSDKNVIRCDSTEARSEGWVMQWDTEAEDCCWEEIQAPGCTRWDRAEVDLSGREGSLQGTKCYGLQER